MLMHESQFRENRNAAVFPPPILADYSIKDDLFEEKRQKQVVGPIRTGFLKRFESSATASELSCDRLMRKLLAFIEKGNKTGAEKKRLER